MAFTKTPEQTTYKTQRFNFVGSPQQRSGSSTKDQRFINLFPELIKTEITEGKKYFLKKRPGTIAHTTPATTGVGRGAYYFNGSLFTAVGTKLLKDNAAVGGVTLVGSNNKVGFTEGDGPYKYLFVCDGVSAWVVLTDGSATQVTDPDFPTPHIPTPIFIDGYICVAKTSTLDIYNSVLEEPLNWVGGDIISAEMYPDNVVGLSKSNNYFLAFGENNIEYFYDNANPTGTPFERNPSAVLQMGCAAADTISQNQGITIFVGSTANGGKTVWTIEGFKAVEVGTEPVKSALDAEGSSISSAKAYCVHHMGHSWWILNLTSRTFVYDLEEKLWHEWQYNNGVFPFNYAADNPTSKPFLLEKNTGFVATLSEAAYQDVGAGATVVSLDCTVVTTKIDFDSFNRKFCHRFTLLGDVPNSAASTIAYVSYSDDDYNTYSTESSLSFNTQMATLTQQGSFRRRAYKVRYIDNYPLRLEGFELDVNIGQQ